ncbi:Hypothetical protein GLP15_3955 [Giardia lamblia P15]|uniref:Uncharacterized protein n=1 Tax=Giardia intestinalis (strain P15) TaxID=658858 RepID=E1F2I5_GIAIA|nr:Hypothetical protein GLP15_3955 [Giardia lamblia P15]
MPRPLISIDGAVMEKMRQIGRPIAEGSGWLPYHDTALSKQISEELKWRALSTNADISFIGFHPRFPDFMIVIAGPLLYIYNALSGDCLSIIEIVPKQDQQAQGMGDKFTVRSACICSELQLKAPVGQHSPYEVSAPVLSVLIVTEEAPRYIIVIEIPIDCKRSEISVKRVFCSCELVEIASESHPFSPVGSVALTPDLSNQQRNAMKSGTSFIYLVESRTLTVCQLNSISSIRSVKPAKIAFPNLISIATTPKHGTIAVASGTRVYFIHIDEKIVAEHASAMGQRGASNASRHSFEPSIIKVLSFDEARESKGIQKISISNDGTKLLLAFKTHMAVYLIDQGFIPRIPTASGPSTHLMTRGSAQEARLIARLHFPEIPRLLDVFMRTNESTARNNTTPYILVDFDLGTCRQVADSFKKQPDGRLCFSHIFTFASNQYIEWSPDDNVVVLASLNGIGDSIYWDISNRPITSPEYQEVCDIDGVIWSPGSVAKCGQMVRKCFRFVPGTSMVVTASNGSLLTYLPVLPELLESPPPDGNTAQ